MTSASVSGDPLRSLRIGLERPAFTTPNDLTGTIEARVLTTELGRRLGDVSIDFRTHGAQVGPWLPRIHAAWPAEIDACVDLADFIANDRIPLPMLFSRTLEPSAVEVRTRMLAHLGVLPERDTVIDDEWLARSHRWFLRPTDLWIIVTRAEAIETSDPLLTALAVPPDDPRVPAVDAAIDLLVEQITHASTLPTQYATRFASLRADRDQLRAHLHTMHADMVRAEVEAADMIEFLRRQLAMLEERLERAELDAEPQLID